MVIKAFPVDGGGAGEDETPYVVVSGGFKDRVGAHGVDGEDRASVLAFAIVGPGYRGAVPRAVDGEFLE